MNKEAQEKLLEVLGESATDDQKTLIASILKDTVSNDDANARAAAERKRAEKRTTELQGNLDSANADLESLRAAGGNDANTAEKLLELERAKAAETTKGFEALKLELSNTQRSNLLGKITSGVNFVEGMNSDIRELAIDRHFKDLTVEDLATPALVDPILASFVESNAALIQAKTVNGGGTHGADAGTVAGSSISRESIAGMKWTPENADAAWAAGEAGLLK
jgi:hypothetical protein